MMADASSYKLLGAAWQGRGDLAWCDGCWALAQVQRAWADREVGGAGDELGVGHVDCVQDESGRGREHDDGCDGGRTRRVADGEPVFRWEHGVERGGDQRGEHGGREPDRERGGLRCQQVPIALLIFGATCMLS